MIASEIYKEVWNFVITLYWGMIFAGIYDGIRMGRRIVGRFHNGIMAMEDICYWMMISLWAFHILYLRNDGELRLFLIVGFFLGAKIYHDAFGKYFMRYGTRLLNFLRKTLKKWKKPITIKYKSNRK